MADIYTLADIIAYPLHEASKILSVMLASSPSAIRTDSATGVMLVQNNIVSPVSFIATNDPILPIFNGNLNALMFQVKEA